MSEYISGAPVMLNITLQAGFILMTPDPRGRTTKEFAAFTVAGDEQQPKFVRSCSTEEKKVLRKLVYGNRALRSLTFSSGHAGEAFNLFVFR